MLIKIIGGIIGLFGFVMIVSSLIDFNTSGIFMLTVSSVVLATGLWLMVEKKSNE